MLEILFLIWFWKKLAAMATAKRRSAAWGALGALGWVGGEVAGFIVAVKSGAEGFGAYGYGIAGAVLGAVIAFVVVHALKELPPADFPTARVV